MKIFNPNILRPGVPLLTAALALGTAACSKVDKQPDILPSPTIISTEDSPRPSCTVSAEIDGRKATLQVKTKDKALMGVYDVGGLHYDFGDNTSADSEGLVQSHEYASPGRFAVSVSMVMEVAPGAEANALPLRDGAIISCKPNPLKVDIR